MARIAVIQSPPVLLDREASLQRAVELLHEAAENGASIALFPEAYLPGYPAWIWRLRPENDRHRTAELHARLLASAVDLERGHLESLQRASREHRITTIIGIDEIDGRYSRSTLYNTIVVLGPDGAILNRHRKLVPTGPERMVWGMGDGSGLRVVQTPAGRVGGLICWENYMPLARHALYAQGVELYVAPTWDHGYKWIGTLQHIAREGRCWVAGCATALQGRDIPSEFPGRGQLYADPEEWVNAGDAVVFDPSGNLVAGPLHERPGIVYADYDPKQAIQARRNLDVAGHYGRPDVFELTVHREAPPPARFIDET